MEIICESATAAQSELPSLREKLAIYQHVQEPKDVEEARHRSSICTWACAEALFKAEKYAANYRNALQDLLPAAEAMERVNKAYCEHEGVNNGTHNEAIDVDGTLAKYREVKSEHDAKEQHLEQLLVEYGELCTEAAEEEFFQAQHDEL